LRRFVKGSAVKDSRHSVLFIIPTLAGGGAERVLTTLLRHIDKGKLRILVAIVDGRRDVYRTDLPADVELIDLNCSRVRNALPRIVMLIRRIRPRVVFSTLGHLNLALAILRPLLPGDVRLVGREASIVSLNNRAYRRPWLWDTAYRWFYGAFDRVVCQSHAMREDLVQNYRFRKAKAIVIHNPVDSERIAELASNSTDQAERSYQRIELLAVGRLSPVKRFDVLIDALSRCTDDRLQLSILGEGPLLAPLQRQVAALNLRNRVRFLGFQANPYPFIRTADALVLCSRYEGFPNVVLEALAVETPVLALPVPGGLGEIAEQVNNVFIADGPDGTALAQLIEKFACGALAMRPFSVAPFEVQRIVAQYEELLCDVADGKLS
jgi:glycosyltransferase involved in cell wall biosynthesis